jgi:hypothetical protein
MYHHVDYRWLKTFLTKLLSVFLIYSIFFTTSANASTVGGWSLGGGVAQGASTVYDGTKQVIIDGKNYIKKGTAIVTPTATGVAKVLAKGVAGVALSVAVEQLLGSVDWVLDPANNQIKYTNPINPELPTYTQIWFPYDQGTPTKDTALKYGASTAEAACKTLASVMYSTSYNKFISVQINGDSAVCTLQHVAGPSYVLKPTVKITSNPNYDPQATEEQEQKTLPLDVVAAQVISNAEGNTDKKAGAQVATGAAAADIVAEAEADQTGVKARPIVDQLNNSSSTKPADETAAAQDATATGTAKPQVDPVTGEAAPPTDIALKFPMLCGLMPVVCEAAQVVVVRVPEAIEAVKEWVKDEEPPEENNDPPQIDEIDIGALNTSTFQGTAGCPSPIQVPVTFGTGGSTEISYEPICQLASKWSFIAPLIGFISGAMILIGVGRKGEDGDS